MPVSKALTIFLKENLATRQLLWMVELVGEIQPCYHQKWYIVMKRIFCEELVKRVAPAVHSHYSNQWKKLNMQQKKSYCYQ